MYLVCLITFFHQISFRKAINYFDTLKKYIIIGTGTTSARQNVQLICESTPECVFLKWGMRVASLFRLSQAGCPQRAIVFAGAHKCVPGQKVHCTGASLVSPSESHSKSPEGLQQECISEAAA